tara:strand:- start:105 stop:707 length:603 start_codon:yes stop_codon:yes gene_type:complete
MKILKIFLISLILLSCSEEEPIIGAIETMVVTNLEASTSSKPGEPQSGSFTKFSFSEQSVVEGDDWDIAFRATTILVNGGFPGGDDEPDRTGIGAGYVEVGSYGSINTIDENKFTQDSQTVYAIPTGSGKGWYNYDFQSHVITPIAGRTLIFKTHNGRYAKVEIQSYYKDSPQTPNITSEAQYYTFNYTYQPNKGVLNFN